MKTNKALMQAGATSIGYGRDLSPGEMDELHEAGLPFAAHYRYWRLPDGTIRHQSRPAYKRGRVDFRPDHAREVDRERQDAEDMEHLAEDLDADLSAYGD